MYLTSRYNIKANHDIMYMNALYLKKLSIMQG